MASKGPRSRLDHETRYKRQKALEASKEPRRPKAHWDHVLDEMAWLSKDFESERKWKLAQAKKVAIRASKGKLDQATRGERKVKEEEQRMRKVALNISKDVKKFWIKIEKLVLYKHQLEVEEKKKKALDRQLDFLLGQTERYSTMLAENLVDMPYSSIPSCPDSAVQQRQNNSDEKVGGDYMGSKEGDEDDLMRNLENPEPPSDSMDVDGDYVIQSEDELVDDEHTIEEDEALITEKERQEELEALQDEMDLPIEELLKRYNTGEGELAQFEAVSREECPVNGEDVAEQIQGTEGEDTHPSNEIITLASHVTSHHSAESNGDVSILDERTPETLASEPKTRFKDTNIMELQMLVSDNIDEQEDGDYVLDAGDEKDDETTLVEEEEQAKAEADDPLNEIELLQQENDLPLEELLARYKKDYNTDEDSQDEYGYTSDSSEDLSEKDQQGSPPKIQDAPTDGTTLEENELGEPKRSVNHIFKEKEVDSMTKTDDDKENENRIADAAAAARSAQPTGNTFLTTKVRTKFPFLLKFPLREYQHIGLDWLVTMYEKRLNGILADEMGLGKTIMTIALLAHLACEKGIWGPHLIVVPTSVMLNWETEFLKWCPAFKILTYFGSAKERKLKRQGWMKPNSFHVCITTYRLVIQDSKAFKRKKWKYLILDEAHLIKNWKSQRWQTLLNFNSKRRILLTGTPLQNDLMELWSLMHFLMPHIFQSHQEFKDWFSNPISGMVEGQEKVNKEVVDRLHNVLRPFILRRLKRDVEKQLPQKYEHVIYCRLSKRQRNLYEDFIASSETQATLSSSNFFGMISVIMQLRKVCNHPDLFEGRPIISSYDMTGIDMQLSSSICMMLASGSYNEVNMKDLGFLFSHLDFSMTSWESEELEAITTPSSLIIERVGPESLERNGSRPRHSYRRKKSHGTDIFDEIQKALWDERVKEAKERATSIAWWNSLKCRKKPMYGTNLRELVTVKDPFFQIHHQKSNPSCYLNFSSKLADIVLSPIRRFKRMIELIECFMFAIPAARAPSPICWCSKTGVPTFFNPSFREKCTESLAPLLSPIRPAIVRRQVYFPDRRLIQFDCGKLQQLAVLLRRLKSEGHRALIFTQMTKMLDVLEAFINLYGYTYMRLDGSTPPEQRQTLMQRFNTNPKIFLFILSTRSGGVGINLVGADTVIFYDSDWNPAMDQQAQDRCHRIGQTREVHIYRLISESTIEENILKKANQKRILDDLVIQSGSYNTEFFKKLDPIELFSGHRAVSIKNVEKEKNSNNESEVLLSNADVEAALKQAEDEADYMALKRVEQEEAVENQEFTDEAIGRLEDDELVNEDDVKLDEKMSGDQSSCIVTIDNDIGATLNGVNSNEEMALTLATKEDDVDMLADVKQLAAAAAAAGQASSSFENQLRPIDRYAMRFLDMWDPIIDKSILDSQASFEEAEWELDRIEKFKEDLEAEIDDDEEPFVYEEWDADFATEAYRQQVEVLAQRQLMEELENKAKEAEDAENEKCESLRNEASVETRPKPKKKIKKIKFKSLKKGPLKAELEVTHEDQPIDSMSIEDDFIYSDEVVSCSDLVTPDSLFQKKRKKSLTARETEDDKNRGKSFKKIKKGAEGSRGTLDLNTSYKLHDEDKESKFGEIVVVDHDHRPVSRTKIGGKISITTMPVKRVLMVKPEKLKKKGNIWLRGVSTPDSWSSSEDAMLCAVVHEYGTDWSLVSDILYGMTAGGFYRGRFRHPVHCCERFRELFQKYILSTTDHSTSEKVCNAGSGKAVLKVTEDGTRTLLDVAKDLPDSELVLQKHFIAMLSSVWRVKARSSRHPSMLPPCHNDFYPGERFLTFTPDQNSGMSARESLKKMNLAVSGQSSQLIAAALEDEEGTQVDDVLLSNPREEASALEERLDITLELQTNKEVSETPLPCKVDLSLCGSHPPVSANEPTERTLLPESSCKIAEHRFRVASEACCNGESTGWASSSFPMFDFFRYRSASKVQSLGKHKVSMSESNKSSKSKLPRISIEPMEEHQPTSTLLLPSLRTVASTDNIGSPPVAQLAFDGVEGGYCHASIDDGFVAGIDNIEVVPHQYDPSFINDLEDCTLLQDIIDIG